MSKNWKCKFCGCEEMWFDRSIEYLPDGTEIGMQNRCSSCGRGVDENPFVKCQNCGSEYEGTPVFCATCGRKINNIPLITSDVIVEKYNKDNLNINKKCQICGSEYEGDVVFCATCMKKVSNITLIPSKGIPEKYNTNNFSKISDLLLEEVAARFNRVNVNDNVEFGDSLAELLEKLLIINIRMWKLEDLASQELDDKKLGELKRKIDFCFKEKRPKLIKAINSFLDTYVTNNRRILEENIKNYG